MTNPMKHARRKLVRTRRVSNPDFTLRPSNAVLREHLVDLHSVLSIAEISRRSGVPEATVHGQLHNRKGHTAVLMDTAQKLMRVRLTDEERAEHMTTDELMWAGHRITQGLAAMGWTMDRVGQECALSIAMLRSISRKPAPVCRGQLSRASYARLKGAAARLEPLDPVEDGKCNPRHSKNVRSRALGRGSAPLTAWDLDEIHKLDAVPEWTGACGTPDGYRIHLREGLPVCPRCREAVGQVETAGCFSPTKFRILVEQSGLTPVELAEKVGATRDSIARWSAGERNPQPKYIDPMCAALNCVEADLFDASGEIFYDKDFDNEKFGLTLEEKGMSKRQLAGELHMSHMAVHYWVTGHNTPKIPVMVKAADALGVDWKDWYR